MLVLITRVISGNVNISLIERDWTNVEVVTCHWNCLEEESLSEHQLMTLKIAPFWRFCGDILFLSVCGWAFTGAMGQAHCSKKFEYVS